VRRPRESRVALGLAIVVLALGASLPGAEGAPPGQSTVLQRQQAHLGDRAHAALLDLYALDTRLAQARTELAALQARTQAATDALAEARHQTAVVSGNLRASQRLLGDNLRRLYEQGEPNTIAVLLGATSLDDAVARLDELDRMAHQSSDVVTQAQDGRNKLRAAVAGLTARLSELRALRGRAERTTRALASTRAERVAYLARLGHRRQLTKRKIAAIASEATRSAARGQAVQEAAEAAQPVESPEPTVATGPRTLTVTATGYSLPGRTALGLPVALGVIAVDPAVIPLGTRLSVPGYGDGIAADTGSAVQGYTIDLWFPTLADALAWGRRTVTITLH
jgi:cystine transport system substrate-binding protein